MKMSLRIIGVFLIFTLLISCVTATENKDLPTKEEINYFIAGIPVSDNYVITVFNTVKDKQPAWNCDTWVDQDGNQILSLYYVDPGSTKGYGSIYFNEFGKEISMLGVKAKLVNHYVGKATSEEKPPVETKNELIKEQLAEKKAQPVGAATENKDLPTKEEINYFIAGIPVSDNYVITVFNTVKDKRPAWNCDTWVDQDGNQILSLYYVDPDSTKGYGSIYFNEFGKEISMLGVKARLVNHYVGKAVSEEYTHVDTTSEEYTHVGTTSKETTSEEYTHVGTTSKETTHVGTTSEETTHVDTPADSTKEESATNQEESESIQKLSEAVQELSESIQQQSDSVQRQTDSVQQQSETDNQQSDPVQRQSETDNQQSDPNQKTILSKFFSYDIIIKCLCYPLLVYFIAHKKGWVK